MVFVKVLLIQVLLIILLLFRFLKLCWLARLNIFDQLVALCIKLYPRSWLMCYKLLGIIWLILLNLRLWMEEIFWMVFAVQKLVCWCSHCCMEGVLLELRRWKAHAYMNWEFLCSVLGARVVDQKWIGRSRELLYHSKAAAMF